MSKSDNYRTQFIEACKNVRVGNEAKIAYLSDKAHRKLRMVVCAIHAPGVTMSAYLDVVLMKHFKDYQDDISAMLDDVLNSTNIEENKQ